MAIALPIVLLLYAAMQGYIVHRVGSALAIGAIWRVAAAAWVGLMTLMPLILWRLEKRGLHRLVATGAWLGYAWMGFAFLLFWILLAFDLLVGGMQWACAALRPDVAGFLPAPGSVFAAAAALALLLAAYGCIEAWRIRLERVVLHSPKFTPGADPLTIVQISDLHLGALVGQRRLRRILAAVAAARPDILVSTGDLVDGQADHLDGLASSLRAVTPRYGKFAVTGNHEFFVGLDRALDFHERAGFTVLRGEGVTVADMINIAGVDDPAAELIGRAEGKPEETLLRTLPAGRFTLLLKHQPVLEPRAQGLFDLQLSGHAHGGQIFPFGLIVRLFYPSRSGLTPLGSGWLYVSRRAGTWGPPMRVLAPPEVSVIELRPEGKGVPAP